MMTNTPPNLHISGFKCSKKRDSNIELYRIIVMFFIVCHHYVGNSGVFEEVLSDDYGFRRSFFLVWGMWGKVGINCFVMITGYYMSRSQITLKKFLKLVLQVEFYNIIINSIFILTGYYSFNTRQLLKYFLPITDVTRNFTGSYLLFFLCIPFLNILIKNMNKKQHTYILLLFISIYSFWGVLFGIYMNYVSWFCILYLIASYIRLYHVFRDESATFWGFLTLFFVFSAIISSILLDIVINNYQYFFVIDCNKILAVLIAVSSFMFFKNTKISYSKIINTIGACTFGVFLIHTRSDAERQWIWCDVFDNINWYHTQYAYLHAIFVPIVIFTIGVIVDKMRLLYFERPLLDPVTNKIENLFRRFSFL